MEHYYENIGENWFSYSKFYKSIVESLPDGCQIVEVGCWKGRSTSFLGVEIINSNKNILLHCVDSWKYIPSTEQPVSNQEMFDAVYDEFLINMKPVNSVIHIIKDLSDVAATTFQDNSLDFIFLDAAHHYENVKNDIESWLPKLKSKYILAGHDYFTRVHPGVKQAVDEQFGKNAEFIPEQNVWMYKKP